MPVLLKPASGTPIASRTVKIQRPHSKRFDVEKVGAGKINNSVRDPPATVK